MRRLHLVFVPVLALALTLAAAGGVAANPHEERSPVEFTLTPAQCPQLQVTVTGMGERVVVTNEWTDRNGVTHRAIDDRAQGTATDDAGGTYRFKYHARTKVLIPPGTYPQVHRVIDHFRLNGKGSADNLRVAFLIILTFTGPDQEPIITPLFERGDHNCDPI